MKFKKIAAAVLAAAMLAVAPVTGVLTEPLGVTANAADTLTEGDYSYTVNEDGETVTITKYTGKDAEVDIPATLGGKTVTSIGVQAFSNCESLISVTIPDSVTTIGENVFFICPLLESITARENNTNYSSINGVLFNSDKSKLLCYPAGKKNKSYIIPDSVTTIDRHAFFHCTTLTSITIPDSVTIIGYSAFDGCESLTDVTIPDSVTTIEPWAFYQCKSLTDIAIPNSVTTIDEAVFCDCTSLTSVTIPDSVTKIRYGAFTGCTSLEGITVGENNANYLSIDGVLFNNDKSELGCYPAGKKNKLYTIPDSVKTIGYNAFINCNSLTSVTIPKNVTTIYDGAFRYCNSLETVNYSGAKAEWEAIEIGEGNECLTNAEIICTDGIINEREPQPGDVFVDGDLEYKVLEDGTLEVTGFASDDLKETVEELIIPDEVKGRKVTSIGKSAFRDCKSLTSVTMPDSVTTIGEYAFFECELLTNITIPDSVTTIREGAFNGCKLLTSVTIPDNVTILESAFFACTSLESIIVGENNANYSSTGGILFNKDKSKLICYPAGKKDKLYTIPGSVTEIGVGALGHCVSLNSITIPDSVTTIRNHAFSWCSSLESVTIPNSVTTISEFAFLSCTSLTNVTIPKSVTTIGDCAFELCTSLTSVTIPDSVTTIDFAAFMHCTSLTTVYYNGTKEQWEKIKIYDGNDELLNATIHFAKEDEEESDTSSEPTTSDTSEPTSSNTSEPTTSDTHEPTSSDTSEPTSSDTSEPTSSNTSEPTTSDTHEPTTSDTSEPTSSNTSEPTSSSTSDPTDMDIYDKKYDITTDVEPSPDAAGVPDDERVKSVTINAANWINKGEINLDEVKVKVREIYDEEGLKRAEEALGKILDGNKYNLLDLTLLYNGEDFSNGYDGLIQVKFKIPDGHKNKTISCYRITEVDGKMVKEEIPGTQTEDSYIIYLEHFSLYALVADGGETADSTDSSESSNAPATSETNNSNPNTGIGYALFPIFAAASATVIISKKKK